MPAVVAYKLVREVFCAAHRLQSNFGERELMPAVIDYQYS